MKCFTTDRNGIAAGIIISGKRLKFGFDTLWLSKELQANTAATRRQEFLSWRFGTTTVLECSMRWEEPLRKATLIPPQESASRDTLVLVNLANIELGWGESDFQLSGTDTKVFGRFNSVAVGSDFGDFHYLIVLPENGQTTFTQRCKESQKMKAVFTIRNDGGTLTHEIHQLQQSFEPSKILK
ncbi:MAG: hypothetical protein JSS83_24550 [Cyanobacteria bacterium SZAS LIN-3]|nr:hypothetical protein [Cyanobacteria bacterium SZAS LIN-3]